ncbi:PaaI family thioesterase [Brevirhabdus sp.]|uniref:PaaI family thioesterase n=1 Tax=Brevirhabdus sp. TaxID=2004514 RepID=UPI00405899DD
MSAEDFLRHDASRRAAGRTPPAPYAFQKLLGFEIGEWRPDYCRLRLELRAEHGNRSALPHGGLHATLLDSAMGFAGCFSPDPDHDIHAMTLTLNVNFLSRPEGGILIAQGWRIGGGKRTFFAEARIADETGHLVATGSGAFRYRG